jgi:hypothetical protein
MNDAQQEWEIGLSSWIIQDGNYGDFEMGQIAEFALEFCSEYHRQSEQRTKSCTKLGAAKYAIIAEVIFLTDKAWVLDFGICAFQESKPPPGISLGTFVKATIHLGIDPFFYFEGLNKLPRVPALIYTWKINSIGRQTAPFIESHDPSGRKILLRDEEKLRYEDVMKTDAWKDDDDGNSEYVLSCAFLPVPPKFKSATAR